MSWFYALNGEQKGPIEEAELRQLVQQGTLSDDSLVWREGMVNWRPYRVAVPQPAGTLAPAVAVVSNEVACSECGKLFSPDQVIRVGNGYVCAGCKPIAFQKLREGVVDSDAERIRKEHISHEASVKSVGVLYFLGGAFLLLAGIGLGFASKGTEGPLVALFFFLLAGAQIWTGIGLRQLKTWARIVSGILSGIGLLGFPLGTLINGYILYLLFSKKGAVVFSDEYKRVIEQTPHIKYRTSVIVWILLGLVLLLVASAVLFALVGHRR